MSKHSHQLLKFYHWYERARAPTGLGPNAAIESPNTQVRNPNKEHSCWKAKVLPGSNWMHSSFNTKLARLFWVGIRYRAESLLLQFFHAFAGPWHTRQPITHVCFMRFMLDLDVKFVRRLAYSDQLICNLTVHLDGARTFSSCEHFSHPRTLGHDPSQWPEAIHGKHIETQNVALSCPGAERKARLSTAHGCPGDSS